MLKMTFSCTYHSRSWMWEKCHNQDPWLTLRFHSDETSDLLENFPSNGTNKLESRRHYVTVAFVPFVVSHKYGEPEPGDRNSGAAWSLTSPYRGFAPEAQLHAQRLQLALFIGFVGTNFMTLDWKIRLVFWWRWTGMRVRCMLGLWFLIVYTTSFYCSPQ